MKKNSLAVILLFLMYSCQQKQTSSAGKPVSGEDQHTVNMMLDSLHRSAAEADFKTYFSFYADSSIFTGTDATERWNKQAFMNYAKPFFDRGKAWDFKPLKRHIYFTESGNYAWFDELLNTQMKICRGSGVLVKQVNGWKLKQYILSATIPNAIMDTVTILKASAEDEIIKQLQSQQ